MIKPSVAATAIEKQLNEFKINCRVESDDESISIIVPMKDASKENHSLIHAVVRDLSSPTKSSFALTDNEKEMIYRYHYEEEYNRR